MARNEEKQSGRLNRLWLQNLDEEYTKKNPPRPGLGSLHTAQDVKKWMPSIKKDIDFYLKQSQVGCYPDRKITEFTEKIDSLTREYKAYLRKYRELEGDRSSTPWSDQSYSRKHKTSIAPDENDDKKIEPLKKVGRSSNLSECSEKTSVIPLSLPILDNEDSYKDIYGYSIVNPEMPDVSDSDIASHDRPLEFTWSKTVKALEYCNQVQSDSVNSEMTNSDVRTENSINCGHKFSDKSDGAPQNLHTLSKCDRCLDSVDDRLLEGDMSDSSKKKQLQKITDKQCACRVVDNTWSNADIYLCDEVSNDVSKNISDTAGNVLNLPYSDSSSDEGT